MPITRTRARRRGITTIPAKVVVSLDWPPNPDGITAEELIKTFLDQLGVLTRPATFADLVAHALRGEKIIRSASAGGKERARPLREQWPAWRAEVANRPPGRSKAAVHVQIAAREGRTPAAVKKAIERLSKSEK